jgi:hypothetical protein
MSLLFSTSASPGSLLNVSRSEAAKTLPRLGQNHHHVFPATTSSLPSTYNLLPFWPPDSPLGIFKWQPPPRNQPPYNAAWLASFEQGLPWNHLILQSTGNICTRHTPCTVTRSAPVHCWRKPAFLASSTSGSINSSQTAQRQIQSPPKTLLPLLPHLPPGWWYNLSCRQTVWSFLAHPDPPHFCYRSNSRHGLQA